ncbi:MAG: DNA repair protein RecN [Clostridiales bacterium]|jgi:DNA repair protein RecN (Recombination protein N)|nr:DNA repair protein RecN [Clostridiales bacterium]
MLERLTIKNVALISELELSFDARLNILSGETGAGKSIIVDSIMLLIGGRYDKTMLRYGAAAGSVEGVFTGTPALREPLFELGLDTEEDVLILSRRFTAEGKNEIRINGRAATLSMLRTISAHLVDICGQNEHQILSDPANHMQVLDYYVRHNTEEIRAKLRVLCQTYRELTAKLSEIGDASVRARSLDLYRFQLDEIAQAAVKDGESDELIARRKKYIASERIAEALSETHEILAGDEGAVGGCHRAAARLSQLGAYGDIYDELGERLTTAATELIDIAELVSDELNETEYSPAEFDELEKRLDIIRGIEKKYGNYARMTAYHEELAAKLDLLENAGDHFDKLLKERERVTDEIYAASKTLSDRRKEAAKALTDSVVRELSELGMADSKFEVVFEPFPTREACEPYISSGGMDRMEFYLSPNAGQPVKPLVKIISGGELSRLMLALKVVSSHIDDTPVLIFDEIDTGISGKVGQEIAKKLARLSKKHQLLCVTHLPQIASMADAHFFISKYVEAGSTFTAVRPLDRTGAIEEVARLSGSKDISAQSSDNAAQMKAWSDTYKHSL